MTQYQKPINPYRYGNNYKEQGEKEEQTLTFAALLYRLLRGLSLRICAHIVLHDLLNSSAEPTCLPKGQHVAMLAGHFSYINLDFERDDALAHRFENHTVLFHLVETGEQFAGDLLELIFFCCAERGPELMQAVMLRW